MQKGTGLLGSAVPGETSMAGLWRPEVFLAHLPGVSLKHGRGGGCHPELATWSLGDVILGRARTPCPCWIKFRHQEQSISPQALANPLLPGVTAGPF